MLDIEIAGAVGLVENVEEFMTHIRELGEILVLDADMVCGRDHLISAVEHATRAFERGTNAASTLLMETLLYASGERQISRAVEKMGVRPGCERFAFVFFDSRAEEVLRSLKMARDDSVLEPSKEKAIRMGISEEEIGSVPAELVPDLVLERVAFVEMMKR